MALDVRLDDEPTLDETEVEADLDAEDKRAYRARTERMVVVPEADVDAACTGLYRVYSQSGKTYVVDSVQSRCDCPDMKHNDPDGGCKHVKRVEMMLNETSLPAPGEETTAYMDALGDLRERIQQELSELRNREVVLERLSVAIRETLGE